MSPWLAAVALGWGTGVDARLGSGAVFLGFGGGPTVTVALPKHFDLHAEARWLVLAGNASVYRLGAGWSADLGKGWSPGLGLDVGLFQGAALRAVTEENPVFAPDVAPVLQLRLDPLRWRGERFTAEALRLQVGSGLDRGAPALSVGVTLAEVGIRL